MKKLRKQYNNLSLWLYFKLKEEKGIGSIELVLILVALIALVLLFKDRMKDVLESFAGKVEGQADKLFK